jgi:hypothetical protein
MAWVKKKETIDRNSAAASDDRSAAFISAGPSPSAKRGWLLFGPELLRLFGLFVV